MKTMEFLPNPVKVKLPHQLRFVQGTRCFHSILGASCMCPVCSRCGRPIAECEVGNEKMAKQLLVKAYEEVSKVLLPSPNAKIHLHIERCTLGWLNVSPYL